MKKKLALTILMLFLTLGSLQPKSVSAYDFCKSDLSPASSAELSCASIEVNQALYDCPVTTINGRFGILSKVGTVIALGQPYDDVNLDICKQTGKAPGALSRQEITAYFQSKGNNNGGAAGILATLNNGLLNQRPASGVDFINEKVYAITNPGKVYAADNPSTYYPGPGSELLRPIQGFWGWSVNLVFGFLVLIIIVVAFAIMFRQRLGGAAEVTIQTAIPSIALAMILIPLSYAISGLFIDAITLGTNVVHGFLLGPQSPGAGVYANRPNAGEEECDIQNVDLGNEVKCDRGFYADDPLIDVWRARDRIDLRKAGAAVGEGINTATAGVPGAQAIYDLIGSILRLLPGDENTFSEFAWFGNIINIIIGILTIWTAIKIFTRLIGKYVTLIIFPAFSPFVFATAALPGNGTKSIVWYLKSLGSCSLFYIVTYAMFLLTLIFTDPTFQGSLPDFRTSGYIPPLLGIQNIISSLTASADAFPLTQLLMTLIGIGIYFSIPTTLDSIDEALGTKFIIPQVLKTPFESMRESLNVTARTAQVGFRRAAELNQTRRTAIPNINRFARNQYDQRVRGLTPGKAGTWQARESTALGNRLTTAQSKAAAAERILATDPNNGAASADLKAANREIREIQNESQLRGVPVGRGEKDKSISLTAKLSWKTTGTDNILTFTRAQIDAFATSSAALTVPAELALEVSNYELTPNQQILYGGPSPIPNTNDFEFGPLIPHPTSGAPSHMNYGISDGPPPIIDSGKMVFGDFHINGVLGNAKVPGSVITLYAAKGPTFNPTGKSKYLVDFFLEIKDPHTLFYGSPTGTINDGLINPNQTIVSFKRMFQIKLADGSILETEKPLSIVIKGSYE